MEPISVPLHLFEEVVHRSAPLADHGRRGAPMPEGGFIGRFPAEFLELRDLLPIPFLTVSLPEASVMGMRIERLPEHFSVTTHHTPHVGRREEARS